MQTANFAHLIFCQLRTALSFAACMMHILGGALTGLKAKRLASFLQKAKSSVHPTFIDCILGIVIFCAQKQMGGVAAWRIIAVMADELILWNGAIGKHISDAMCKENLVATYTHPAIPSHKARGLPFPAFIWFTNIHSAPKAGNDIIGEHHNLLCGVKPPGVSASRWHSHVIATIIHPILGVRH